MSGALTKIIELVDSRVRVTTFYPLCITSYNQAANTVTMHLCLQQSRHITLLGCLSPSRQRGPPYVKTRIEAVMDDTLWGDPDVSPWMDNYSSWTVPPGQFPFALRFLCERYYVTFTLCHQPSVCRLWRCCTLPEGWTFRQYFCTINSPDIGQSVLTFWKQNSEWLSK